jgi:tetratricopeptide (TPR) repeat protein
VLPSQSQSVAALEATVAKPVQSNRASARTFFSQALAAQTAGASERAVLLLQQAVALDPTLKAAYNSLGNLYYQQQQYQQAVAMYRQALAIDPDYVKARNNLGNAYLRLAMDDHARVELQQALRADSTYGLAYYNLACVYARAGDSDAAAQYLQQAIALEPQARTWAHTDDDFARVRTAPVLQQLLGP